jgi:hypothetical protein
VVGIQSKLALVPFGDVDILRWVVSKNGMYLCDEMWEAIITKSNEVSWWKIVWNFILIPWHGFILWLALRNSLMMGDHLLSWGFQGDVLCPFCQGCIESREHLYFQCGFSCRIWRVALQKCLIENPKIE